MGSFGAALRRTREEKGVSLDQIAGETRLSKRYLLALEDEAIHQLPGGTYNRAYLRSYAAYLGLEIEPLVREYAREEAHQTETGRLKPQLDVLASIGKAVESRQTSTGAQSAWGVVGNWRLGRERLTLFAGVGLLTVAVLSGLSWIGSRGFGEETTVPPATAVDGRTVVLRPDPPPAPAVAVPQDEVPGPPRTSDPPPASSRSDGSGAVASPKSTAALAAPPVVPKPLAPAPDRTRAAATSRAAAAAPAKARPTPRATKGRLSVTNSGVGSEVVDKRLVGQSDTFAVGTRVTFWTRIAGGRAGDTISHVWFHNGVRIGATSLRVGSSSWRTQSNQLLSPDGQWAVEARDAAGRVLVRHDFRAAR